jgi:hypothetical protein
MDHRHRSKRSQKRLRGTSASSLAYGHEPAAGIPPEAACTQPAAADGHPGAGDRVDRRAEPSQTADRDRTGDPEGSGGHPRADHGRTRDEGNHAGTATADSLRRADRAHGQCARGRGEGRNAASGHADPSIGGRRRRASRRPGFCGHHPPRNPGEPSPGRSAPGTEGTGRPIIRERSILPYRRRRYGTAICS